jgi:cysteine synthase B
MAAMPGSDPQLSIVPPRLGKSLLELIGNTPLLRIQLFEDELPDVQVFAKAEYRNPGGSVKDRPALRMITEAERQGLLTRDRVILDATSGNTGVAYAMIGAAKGYGVHLVMPRNVSAERRALVHAYGAEVTFSDPMEGSDGAIRLCREILASAPDRYYMPDQYNNPENWRAHYHGTGPEIWEQTHGSVSHFVAALGTGGTFVGTGRRLRELNPQTHLCSVQPEGPWHGLEGLKHMESSIVPGIYDPNLADQDLGAPTEEAYDLARRLATTQGILVGHSSGANLWGVREVGREIGQGVIVTIFADGGDRYLSTGLYGLTPP